MPSSGPLGVQIVASLVFTFSSWISQAAAPSTPDWRAWDMLIGNWIADEGHGQPGTATSATFSFAVDLDRRILVRRDHSEYAATQGRPAAHHDGLMIIYEDGPGRFGATSFDNEGHVISYAVDVVSPTRIVLTSPARRGEPRYRLTYDATPRGLTVAFAIAPPNRPDAFAVYVEGMAHRAP